jgi:hypothetical protein
MHRISGQKAKVDRQDAHLLTPVYECTEFPVKKQRSTGQVIVIIIIIISSYPRISARVS